jgi:hypothetical protein
VVSRGSRSVRHKSAIDDLLLILAMVLLLLHLALLWVSCVLVGGVVVCGALNQWNK